MLIQLPYSLDEMLATLQFLRRCQRAGRQVARVPLFGDTDDGAPAPRPVDELDRPLPVLARDMVGGGVSLPWTLALCAAIGAWLMFTRLTLGSQDMIAHAHHLIGSLVLTTTAIAAAEVARPARFVNCIWAVALMLVPFLVDTTATDQAASVVAGLALLAASLPRGRVRYRDGGWNAQIV
jgi:hypothetical protein